MLCNFLTSVTKRGISHTCAVEEKPLHFFFPPHSYSIATSSRLHTQSLQSSTKAWHLVADPNKAAPCEQRHKKDNTERDGQRGARVTHYYYYKVKRTSLHTSSSHQKPLVSPSPYTAVICKGVTPHCRSK